MRRVTWTDQENQTEGWFHEFSTAGDEPGVLGPIAIVELDDGSVQEVGIGQYTSFRFVTPYQPEAQAKDSPFDSAEDYGDYETLGISGDAGFDSIPSAFSDDPTSCEHIGTGANRATMTNRQDSRDSAEAPNIQ